MDRATLLQELQEERQMGQAPVEGGGFDEATYEDVRQIHMLRKATLPPKKSSLLCRRNRLMIFYAQSAQHSTLWLAQTASSLKQGPHGQDSKRCTLES